MIKAASLGNDDAIKALIEAVDEGKADDNEVLKVIQEQAEKNNDAKIFLGRQMLKGKKINSPEKIVAMLQELGNTTYSGNNEALLILSKCYEKGTCVEKNANKAAAWCAKAAMQGSAEAAQKLWSYYQMGSVVMVKGKI